MHVPHVRACRCQYELQNANGDVWKHQERDTAASAAADDEAAAASAAAKDEAAAANDEAAAAHKAAREEVEGRLSEAPERRQLSKIQEVGRRFARAPLALFPVLPSACLLLVRVRVRVLVHTRVLSLPCHLHATKMQQPAIRATASDPHVSTCEWILLLLLLLSSSSSQKDDPNASPFQAVPMESPSKTHFSLSSIKCVPLYG